MVGDRYLFFSAKQLLLNSFHRVIGIAQARRITRRRERNCRTNSIGNSFGGAVRRVSGFWRRQSAAPRKRGTTGRIDSERGEADAFEVPG